jgi:hypothetical protein
MYVLDARNLELDNIVADRVTDVNIQVIGMCFPIRVLASYHTFKSVVLMETLTRVINENEWRLIVGVRMCVKASHSRG